MWGTTSMLSHFLRDKDCWLRHMTLDAYRNPLYPDRPATGLDLRTHTHIHNAVRALTHTNMHACALTK